MFLYVCHALCRAKTAERIDVQFGMKTPGDTRNVVLDVGVLIPVQRGEGSGGMLTIILIRIYHLW